MSTQKSSSSLKAKTISVPRDQPFSHPEQKADEWEVETVCKYFAERLDLPQYTDDIKQLYINGQSFISFHEEVPFSGFKVSHPIHKIKILSHAERLRDQVLGRAAKHDAKLVKHYSAADTAVCLLKAPEIPKLTAVLALRQNWCAKNLEKLATDKILLSKLAPLQEKDRVVVAEALSKLVKDNPDLVEKKPETDSKPKSTAVTKPEKAKAEVQITDPPLRKVKQPKSEDSKVSSEKSKADQALLVGSNPQKIQDISLIDVQALEADRKVFIEKVKGLEEILVRHVEDMQHLKIKAEKLEKEREIALAEKSKIANGNKLTQKVIESLVKDRDYVANELQKISNMYYSQLEQDKAIVANKIDKLSQDIISAKREVMDSNNNKGKIISINDFRGSATREEPALLDRRRLYDGDSDLESVIDNIKSTNNGTASEVNADNLSNLQPNINMNKERGEIRSFSTTNRLPVESVEPIGEDIKFIALSSSSHNVNGRAEEAALLPEPAARVLNMHKYLQSSIQSEVDVWQRVLKKFKIADEVAGVDNSLSILHGVGDTRQALLDMAAKWMSLGRGINQHSLTDIGQREGLKSALIGLRRCSSNALETQYFTLFPDLSSNKTADKQHLKSFKVKLKLPPAQSREAMEAVFNTFLLAIITRLFHRFSKNEDKTQLMFLLNQAQSGELPFSEVSRENFRDFLNEQINTQLPWEQFDSAMQRIDVNKSGFIHSHEVFAAFLKLTPLSDKLKAPMGQQVTQLLLTLCSEGLIHYQQKLNISNKSNSSTSKEKGNGTQQDTLSQTWLHLLLSRRESSASFQKYLDVLEHPNNENKKSMSCLLLMREKELRQYLESKWVEDQLLITDLIFELSKEFIEKAQLVILDSPHNKHFFSGISLVSAMNYIINYHQEVCSIVAKSMNIYNNVYKTYTHSEGKDILQEFSNFLLDFSSFRIKVLEYTLRNDRILINEEMVMQFHEKIKDAEQWLLVSTNQPTPVARSKSNASEFDLDSKILEDWKVAELMSVFIPYPSQPERQASEMFLPCFSSMQSLVELALIQATDKMVRYVNSKEHMYSESAALKEVQQEIHKTLWQRNTLTTNLSTLKNTTVPLAGHLIETINDFNHQQRVDQVTQYLEILNQRAVAKKKLLQTLVQLWGATKQLISPPSNGKSRRTTASREEIILQTRSLQDRLLEDMQRKPHVKNEQLERRVHNLITAIFPEGEKREYCDVNAVISSLLGGTEAVDEALCESLLEVQSLQQSLLQANNDAMRLSARILQSLIPS